MREKGTKVLEYWLYYLTSQTKISRQIIDYRIYGLLILILRRYIQIFSQILLMATALGKRFASMKHRV